ncbi:MAG: class I SAM-dependent methyltransferase [Gammaproteobacteria bacterium]|nr:class I SAM-dependent methyltransferase [Gammaproteobacteria bacterium]MDE0366177.1 class I SAM-dependent methyltransferase [Gammaproteobacteria bacterium]
MRRVRSSGTDRESGAVTGYYDRLSPLYRDNMGWDWEATMREEGAILDRMLTGIMGRPGPYRLLDCSCGVGTQAIGLAILGHGVHATDLSRVSIECARAEAERLEADMSFGVADYRRLEQDIAATFDIVLSCDNSIAHCLTDTDLAAALNSMKSRLEPDGLLLISVRDYDALVADRPRFNNQHVQDRTDGRRIVFQLWDWDDDGSRYRVHQFLLRDRNGGFSADHFETRLRALLRDELIAAARNAGFSHVRWHPPEDTGYYQPIITARNL